MSEQSLSFSREKIDPDLLKRFIKLNRRNIAVYSMISLEPPIFYVPRFASKIDEFNDSFQILFEYLKGKRAYFLYVHYSFVTLEDADAIVHLEKKHRCKYPNFEFIHLCNFREQLELLQSFGLKTFLCNHNAMVDQDIFKPLPNSKKKYDAVYDARLERFKRHYLAAKQPSLGLIYYSVVTEDEPEYAQEIKENFRRAKFFNHDETGAYRKLSPAEVNRALNQCRVGLCLSAEEGAMYASIQYLLAGLPVVTTPNVGGRDEFFDDEIAVTVEPNAEAVKRGVEEMIARNITAEYVRAKTLARIEDHRGRFIELIQDIYDREGIKKDFSNEWNLVFFNKLVKNQKHLETIELLKNAGY